VASTLLYGRGAELDALGGLTNRLLDGGGGALVVRGEAGIGKSALLAAAAQTARDRGARVLATAGVQGEMHLPFAGLHQLLQPFLGSLDKLPTPQRHALQAAFGMTDLATPELFLIALAALEMLAEAASRTPLLVVAEDAQWLDRPSSDVLAFVARRVSLEPIVVLVAIREGSTGAFEAAGLPEWRLEPLDHPAASELLRTVSPDLAPDVSQTLLSLAAGNPLALEELPSLIGSGKLSSSLLLPNPLPLSARLERAFAFQAVELPALTRVVLLVAAADEGGVLTDVLAAASLVADQAVTGVALDPAVSARLVRLDKGKLTFRHPLVRSAVYQAATAQQRRAAHAALATVVEEKPGGGVWHRAAAAIGPDEAVASDLETEAAHAQQRGAIAVAVAALERAADLSSDPVRRGGFLLRAAEMAVDLGRPTLIDGLLREAETLQLGRLELGRVEWIREMIAPGMLGDAKRLRLLVELADAAAHAGDTDLGLNLLWLAATRCWWGDAEQSVQDLVVGAADRMGALESDPRLLGVIAYAAPAERGRAVIDSLSASRGGDVVADRLRGSAATVSGAFDLAAPYLAASADVLRNQGRLGHLPRVLVAQAWAAVYVADWRVALPLADEAARLATETNDALFGAGARVVGAMVAALRGDAEHAERLVVEVERTAAPLGARFLLAMGQLARGVAALGGGRHQQAYDELQRLFDPRDPVSHHFIRFWALGDLADAALHSGHTDAARALIAEIAPVLDGTPSEGVHTGLRHAHAVLAADRDAEEMFEHAMSADLSRWPLARARLFLAYGTWLRRARRPAESRAPLRLARDGFDAVGAAPWGDRARQELRASGETSGHRQADARDRLTPQELQIAQMAADGRSNREIGEQLYMSHRTVGSHLYHIFPKLGITSRNRLRAALAGTGAVT
jgi:DNA-binding CsgD family transcriptional regulator